MSTDLIIVVPKGTRVRHVESESVDQVFVIDASKLAVVDKPAEWFDVPLTFMGLPVYETPKFDGLET